MLAELAAARALFVSGALEAAQGVPPDGTLHLLSPAEPGFWAHLRASPEWADGAADPLDRWSARVVGEIAAALGGIAVFPFGGPPFAPFFTWALASGRAHRAPVGLLVHDRMGLFASWRGAVWLPGRAPAAAPPPSPCIGCAAPCLSACPPRALTGEGYDLAACHRFLETAPGESCLSRGCAVRRACPASQNYGRLDVQNAWHMRHFHR